MMKNKFLKIVLFTLISVMLLGSVGCSNQDGAEDGGVQINRVSYQGTHQINVTETENYLVKNGKTDYVVVTPKSASNMITQVKTDFLILFKKEY